MPRIFTAGNNWPTLSSLRWNFLQSNGLLFIPMYMINIEALTVPMVSLQSVYQLLSICLIWGTNVFTSGYLFYYNIHDNNIWMSLNNQYTVALSVNNTTHSEIKVNLLFMISYMRCKSETGQDNCGQQWTKSADKKTVIYYKYPHRL